MSRTKKLKLLAKSTKTAYHPTAKEAAAYERVTQFVMQQARMAHEAGFQKGIGLDTAETMGAMVRDGNEARRLLATVLDDDSPEAFAAARVFLSQPPPRMVPKPQVSPVALAHSDSAPVTQPSAPSDAAAPPPPDAAPADASPAAPPP